MNPKPNNRDTVDLSFKDHIILLYFFIAFYPDEKISNNEKKILEKLLMNEVFHEISKQEFENCHAVMANVWNECKTAQDSLDRFEQSLTQVEEMISNENIITDPNYTMFPENNKLEKLLRDLVEISTENGLFADALKMLQTAAIVWGFEVYEDKESVEIVNFMKWDKWDGYGEEYDLEN